MRPSLPAAAVAFAILSQIAGAQGLGSTEFESRRRELRARYAAAESLDAKQEILGRFRQLELARGGSPEATSGNRETLGRLFEGERPEVVDGLVRGLEAQELQSRGGAGTGLGSAGDRRADPRIAELEELIRFSEHELSDALFADYSYLTRSGAPSGDGTLAEASRDGVQQYRDFRNELRSWLENGRRELAARRAGNVPSWPLDPRSWGFVLSETGASRRLVADWVRQHFAWQVRNDRAELRRLGATLARERQALERIQQAMRDAQQLRDAVHTVLEAQEWVERLQRTFESVVEPTNIPAAVLEEIFEQIDQVDDAIERGVAVIADHNVRLAAAAEGHESVADALRAVAQTMESIRQTEVRLANDLRRMENARQIMAVPFFRSR